MFLTLQALGFSRNAPGRAQSDFLVATTQFTECLESVDKGESQIYPSPKSSSGGGVEWTPRWKMSSKMESELSVNGKIPLAHSNKVWGVQSLLDTRGDLGDAA